MGPKERMLLRAAGKGDLKEINQLVQDGAILSAINEDGESALTKAISKGHMSVAKLLLEKGATTDYSGPLVEKPLHIAVKSGKVKLVELLLDHGADVDEIAGGISVLSRALTAGREDIISLLLSRDADLNLAKYPMYSPLVIAIRQKNERLIKDLLKHGSETDILLDRYAQILLRAFPESCRSLLHDWRVQRYEDQIKMIRSPSSDNAEKEKALATALICASKQRQPEIHSMFMELAEEFNITRTKEFVYRS
jgi:ankyrin repeat protein